MKDEERAFPVFAEQFTQYGMTLRDYFAGQALIAFMAGQPVDWTKLNVQRLAEVSYRISDAMLTEREKRNGKDNG